MTRRGWLVAVQSAQRLCEVDQTDRLPRSVALAAHWAEWRLRRHPVPA